MIGQLLAKVIGTQNERELKRLQPRVGEIGALEGIFCAPEGAACLPALRKLLAAGEVEKGERVVLFNTGAGVKYLEAFS